MERIQIMKNQNLYNIFGTVKTAVRKDRTRLIKKYACNGQKHICNTQRHFYNYMGDCVSIQWRDTSIISDCTGRRCKDKSGHKLCYLG